MKKLICTLAIALLALPFNLQAAETISVELAWDLNYPEPYGYEIFCREAGDTDYNLDYPDWSVYGDSATSGTVVTCGGDQTELNDETTYYFIARAVTFGLNPSENTTEVEYLAGSSGSGDSGDTGDTGGTEEECETEEPPATEEECETGDTGGSPPPPDHQLGGDGTNTITSSSCFMTTLFSK